MKRILLMDLNNGWAALSMIVSNDVIDDDYDYETVLVVVPYDFDFDYNLVDDFLLLFVYLVVHYMDQHKNNIRFYCHIEPV